MKQVEFTFRVFVKDEFADDMYQLIEERMKALKEDAQNGAFTGRMGRHHDYMGFILDVDERPRPADDLCVCDHPRRHHHDAPAVTEVLIGYEVEVSKYNSRCKKCACLEFRTE